MQCFALLDDNLSTRSDSEPARASRLYTQLISEHRCNTVDDLDRFWRTIDHRISSGLHAVMLIDYEWGVALQSIPSQHLRPQHAMRVLLFKELAFLSQEQTTHWLNNALAEQTSGAWIPPGFSQWHSSIDQATFSTRVERIRSMIAAGDTYQANLTYRLHAKAYGHPIALYQQLRERQPVAYGALICMPAQCQMQSSQMQSNQWVLSRSPELFARCTNGRIEAQPMKGTAARQNDQHADQQTAQWLANDSKNRAENLMIVDLLRNDLGRIAKVGSVRVPHLFQIESFATLHQMTSTITAELRPEVGMPDVLRAIFPCGSITGAPKIRTMQIIDELETTPRGLYTGAIGWLDAPNQALNPDQRATSNFCLSVAIRTITLEPIQAGSDQLHQATAGVGGGIVYDSSGADEWQETLVKTRFMTGLEPTFTLFETMRVELNHGSKLTQVIALFDQHMARLKHSAASLGFKFDANHIRHEVELAVLKTKSSFDATTKLPAVYRLRLDLQCGGQLQVTMQPLQDLHPSTMQKDSNFCVVMAEYPVPAHEQWLIEHKTSLRTTYDQAIQKAQAIGAFDALFFNAMGQLTEGARSSVFVLMDNRWVTPALSCGLLPGVMRAIEIKRLKATQGVITKDQLLNAQSVMVCNALRGAIEVKVANTLI